MSIKQARLAGAAIFAGFVTCLAPPSHAASITPPATIYAHVCGYCHGTNVGPIILGKHVPVDVIKMYVRRGPAAMPAFRPTEITDAELDALAQWISVSQPNPTEHGQ